jgi:hypothetical protein
MENFSQAFVKARDVLEHQTFEAEWSKALKELRILSLMKEDGPDVNHAPAVDSLRRKLREAKGRGRIIRFFLGDGAADTILAASANGGNSGKVAERAATLKMLKHFYLARKRGGQDVWVYSPPRAYSRWVFDEITGPDNTVRSLLAQENEIYSPEEREIMCDALLLALNWSQDAVRKLGAPDDEARKVVRRWFADEDCDDEQLDRAIATLLDGFKKITNVANSGRMVFSDEPLDRNRGGWKDWAFVYRSEKLDVLYLQGAFLKAGNTGKLWMCALTIIHEISHRALATDDVRYDYAGLKPSRGVLSTTDALRNADSWAYFATDLAGKLSGSDRSKVLK